MRFPDKSPYKVYSIIFAWFCMGDLASLLLKDSGATVFYHALSAFDMAGAQTYALALLRGITNMICLFPLFLYAFNKRSDLSVFFRILFGLRIIMDIMGHSYDWLFLQSIRQASTLEMSILVIFYGAFFIPSYRAHYILAFKSPERPDKIAG